MNKLLFVGCILMSSCCTLYTNVPYKVITVFPYEECDYYEIKYKKSRFIVKGPVDKYTFGDTLTIK